MRVAAKSGTFREGQASGSWNDSCRLSANGSRLLLTRDVANITLDVNGVQTVNLRTLGGTDNVVINDLTETDVTQVNVASAVPVASETGRRILSRSMARQLRT